MPLEQLLMAVNGPPDELAKLVALLSGHGFREATDIAYVEEYMFENIFGERTELADLLPATVAHARPLSAGGSVR